MALRIAGFAVAVLLALAAGALLFKVASRPPGPMEAEEFERIVRQVSSLARETALLCEQIREDRLTDGFARTHRGKLEEELGNQAGKLQDAVSPPLAGAAERARGLAAQLQSRLEEMKLHLAEAPALESVQANALRIADEIERLAPR
jgi:hypothetical protein